MYCRRGALICSIGTIGVPICLNRAPSSIGR
jgi:hypothetical protein